MNSTRRFFARPLRLRLSATVGHADRFCHWVELTRRVPMKLVESRERKVPLHHEYREAYVIEVVRDLAVAGDVPAILFSYLIRNMNFARTLYAVTTLEPFAAIEERIRTLLASVDSRLIDELIKRQRDEPQ